MASVPESKYVRQEISASDFPATSAAVDTKCFFCGYCKHPRFKAHDAMCNKYQKKGQNAKVCRSSKVPTSTTTASTYRPTLATVTSATMSSALSKATTKSLIYKGSKLMGLLTV